MEGVEPSMEKSHFCFQGHRHKPLNHPSILLRLNLNTFMRPQSEKGSNICVASSDL
jgi:hypothetical protein